jgi:predicted GNAT family N-acyltransferase
MEEASSEAVFERVTDDAGWQAAKAIRERVFVEEQACPPEEEFDEWDAKSRHLLVRLGGEPAATSRWRVVTKWGKRWAKLERFAVLPEKRGGGMGRRLVDYTMAEARAAGHHRFLIHAQAHLQSFYESFGFNIHGDTFEEAGIPHYLMTAEEAS